MRLVTRADLDGLSCAVIITSCESIDEVRLVHPQDITDRRVEIGESDILANLPFHPDCGMWFDNHLLTDAGAMPPAGFAGRYAMAPSAARVVFDHYLRDHPDLARYHGLLDATDKLDSARLDISDIERPQGFLLLGLTLDPRTGLGAHKDYFYVLLDAIKRLAPSEVIALPEVAERIEQMRDQDDRFREVLRAHSRVDGCVVVTDFRSLESAPVGNRFIVYGLYPGVSISLRVQAGPTPDKLAVSVGHSILNRTNRTNVGVLMSMHRGGGHRGAGSCLIDVRGADVKIQSILDTLNANGEG